MGTKPQGEELSQAGEPATSERRSRWPGATSTPPSAAGPGDYAALETVFVAGLLGVIGLARRQERAGRDRIQRADLPVLAVATFALADVVAKEKVSTWLREPFVRESADHKPTVPEGSGIRYAIGELLTCTRCVGTWSALTLVGLWTASPAAGRTASSVLALTGANDLLQSGFQLLAERTNKTSLEVDAARKSASPKDTG
ncbi:DUF1360 domain-containing protein [Conexibacter sp. DBS9H8]|uniref:DUF1360 domain-containing protein n=1 Tax=Conexibacter sp. DBS9H8 TaxID=2937801 RepID=UPI00200BF725|nr:DUF1360 domain-containing protein [Conexibacter sp. DBS9H8]